MEISSLSQNKKDKNIFVENNLQNEFNSILKFISELSEVPYVHLNIKDIDDDNKSSDYSVGFSYTIADDLLSILNVVILQNKVHIISGSEKESGLKLGHLNNSLSPLVFFAGFPIVNKLGEVIGTLSIMNLKPKKLSTLQLKIISQSIINIQFLIILNNKNNELQKTLDENEIQFDLYHENSLEITYQLDEIGVVTQVSKKSETLLGHNRQNVIGTDFTSFIHPKDLKTCTDAIKNLTEQKTVKEEVICRIRDADGRFVWHSSSLKIVKKEKGFYFIGNSRNITQYVEANQKLEKQREFYINILDRLPTDVAVFDNNHKYIYLNPRAIKDNELRKFIIGKDDFEYAIHTDRDPAFATRRRAKFVEAAETKELIEWEDELIHADGTMRVYQRKLNPVFRKDGTLQMMVGFGIDITESLTFQKEIIESRQLIERILENVAVGIVVFGPNSEIIEKNKASSEMLGVSPEQLAGISSANSDWSVIHPDGKHFKPEDLPVQKAIKEIRRIESVVMGVFRPLKKDLVWLIVDAIPIFKDDKSLNYVICSFNNITNQKNAENKLKISNERFLYSNKASSDVIWDLDLATKTVFYGDGYSENFGFNLNNTVHNVGAHKNLIHPSDKDKTYASINAAILGTDDFWEREYRHLKLDNTFAIVKDTAYIVRDEKGEAIRVIGAMKNITEQRRLKDELQRSEEQFKGAFNHGAAGMALINDKGYYIEVNSSLIKILGYTSSEMKFLRLEDIMYNVDLRKYLIYKEKLDLNKISDFTIETRFIHKNSSKVWTAMSVSLVKNIKNKYYTFQFIDITSRKKIEHENKLLLEENYKNKQIQLDEAKQLYRLLAHNTLAIVCLHNLDTTFKYVSPSITNLFGYSPEELIGKFPLDYADPKEADSINELITNFIADRVADYSSTAVFKPLNIQFRHKNGVYIWVEVLVGFITENGVLIGVQTSCRDITSEIEAELASKKALLRQRELNELRTNLVSTISHEFRTPMTTIRTSAELINMYLEGQNIKNGPQLQKRVDIITQEIDRIVELMNAVLTISKEDSGKTTYLPTLFNLKTLCIETIDKNFTEVKGQGKVKIEFTGNNFLVYADKNLMEYSISNLLSNGFKYSDKSADIELNIQSIDTNCVVKITDYGIGIPEKDIDKVFNTFYRASNTDGIPGTGLGLHIVKTFVKKNKGTVSLESELGKGTKVTASFPLIKQKNGE